MSDEKKFAFTYSAPTQNERKEIESIRRRYLPQNEAGDAQRLRELDNKVNRFPTAISLAIGITGTLIFGFGLALTLEWQRFLTGFAAAVIGMVILAAAYPVYKVSLNRSKKKYGAEILELCDKLLHQNIEE